MPRERYRGFESPPLRDAGATWESVGENLRDAVSLVPDPAPGGALYAATAGGLFKWVPGE